MVWYFAYGSNMNAKRMMDRVSTYTNRIHAILKGYGIIFNKVARKNPKKGYANVVPAKDSIVEGILYEIHDRGLEALDAREGYPEDYGREIVSIELDNGKTVPAWVYIANPKMVRDGLLPDKDYLEHLIAGCDLLSSSYCEKLRTMKTLD